MNAPISRSSAALLAVGAVAILLLGAFTRSGTTAAPPAPAVDTQADAGIEAVGEPELPSGLSPGLAEIFRLARAHVDESVILAFIQNSGQTYSPTAEEILYLSDLGLSQPVIAALFKLKTPGPPASPKLLAAAAADTTATMTPVAFPKLPSLNAPRAAQGAGQGQFYDALAPYGTWTQIPDYGQVWQPTTETLNPDWCPYLDQGQWLSTDNGLYWQSDYSWGWAAFHYGRWKKEGSLGWVWVPDKVWAPAWVSWRVALSYSGWAPLPPGVGLATAATLALNNRPVASGFNTGIPAGWFTFVSEANFLSRNLPSYAVPPGQAAAIYSRSIPVNNYSIATQKVINTSPDQTAATAAAATETVAESFLIKAAPARSLNLAGGPLLAPEDDAGPVINAVARGEAVGAPPRQGAALPALPLAHVQKPRRSHWKENSPANWSLASSPRMEPPVNRETFDRNPGLDRNHSLEQNQSVEPLAHAPPPEPARMMAASAPASSKSGK